MRGMLRGNSQEDIRYHVVTLWWRLISYVAGVVLLIIIAGIVFGLLVAAAIITGVMVGSFLAYYELMRLWQTAIPPRRY